MLRTPGYGYSLLETLSEAGFEVEANTLYPLLRRLESQGLLTSSWNTDEARPRKFYRTTEQGASLAEVLTPAIGYAQNGHPLLERANATIATVAELFRQHWPTSAAVYLPNDTVPPAGTRTGGCVTDASWVVATSALAACAARRAAAIRSDLPPGSGMTDSFAAPIRDSSARS